MPNCPYCGREINHLLADARYTGYKTYHVTLGNRFLMWDLPDYVDEEDEVIIGYRCPRCHSIIFEGDTPNIEIERFFKKETSLKSYEAWSEEEW